MDEPTPDEVDLVTRYAEDLQREVPKFTVRRYLIYIAGQNGYRVFWSDAAKASISFTMKISTTTIYSYCVHFAIVVHW